MLKVSLERNATIIATMLLSAIVCLVYAAAATAQVNCPTINGRFVMHTTVDGKPKRANIDLYTRVENGVYSYATTPDGTFQVADGVPRTRQAREYQVKLTVRCTGKNTLEREVTFEDNGQKIWSKITPLDSNRIQVESDNPAASGIHVRE